MRKGLYVLAAIGLGGFVILALLGRSLVGTVSGVDETRDLRDTLRVQSGRVLAADPPLRVLRVPQSGEWPGWRWKIEGALRPGSDPSSPAVARLLDRMAAVALKASVGGKPPTGVMVDLRLPDGGVRRVLFDRRGRRVDGPPSGTGPKPAAGPPAEATPVPAEAR